MLLQSEIIDLKNSKQLLRPARLQPPRAVKQQRAGVMANPSLTQPMDGVEDYQQNLEAVHRRCEKAERRVLERDADIADLQRQLQEMRNSFETLRQQQAAALQQEQARIVTVHDRQRGQLETTNAARLAAEQENEQQHQQQLAALDTERERERIATAVRQAAEQAALAVLSSYRSPASSTLGDRETASGTAFQLRQGEEALTSRLAFSVTIDTLPKFNATNPTQTVQKWIARVDEDAEVNGWNEQEKFLAAKRALDGAARRWLDSHDGVKNWTTLRRELVGVFGRQIKSSDIHDNLRNRKRKKNETIIDFVHEMEFIAAQADLADDVVREYIARGFTDNVHACASLSTVPTRAQFMTMLELYDKQGLSTQHGGAYHKDSQGKYSTKICYECGEQGHISRFCDKNENTVQPPSQSNSQDRGRGGQEGPSVPNTCFKCNQKGHNIANCPRNPKGRSMANASINHVVFGGEAEIGGNSESGDPDGE